jgi:hypothetical protein
MQFLLLLFKDRSGRIARAVHLRPVDLRLHFGFMPRRPATARSAPPQDMGAHTLGLIGLDRARMRLLLGYANRCESVQYFPALNFQLSR